MRQTKQEERQCIENYRKTNNSKHLTPVFKALQGLLESKLKKYPNPMGFELDVLRQQLLLEALIGLNTFDSTKDIKFTSYVSRFFYSRLRLWEQREYNRVDTSKIEDVDTFIDASAVGTPHKLWEEVDFCLKMLETRSPESYTYIINFIKTGDHPRNKKEQRKSINACVGFKALYKKELRKLYD